MVHLPVLCDVVLKLLDYPDDAIIVDATVGQGGHAVPMAQRLGPDGLLVGLDVDENSLASARGNLSAVACQVKLLRGNFGVLGDVLSAAGIGPVDVILADLGVSSAQLGDGRRGLSFQLDGPLDMRLDDRLDRTAADLVNRLKAEELADLIYQYGQERHSRRIARQIVARRKEKRIETTGELVAVINEALRIRGPGRRSRINPATQTFQALRIAVNDELGNLTRLLAEGAALLKPGGQIAIISFQSLEDRLVKNNFRENKQAGRYEVLTRKPIVADQAERDSNPRSRSAKLRVARRIAEGPAGEAVAD